MRRHFRLLVVAVVVSIPAVAWAYDRLTTPAPCPVTPDCPCNHGAS